MKKLYCDTCIVRTRASKERNKCPYCDGYIRQNESIKKEKLVWIKKGMIWVQKK